ncbi:MAG: hypothetical protein IK077_16260 [Thermoguttaceae bacterium]|nr:hypothetical protein [Thermoguttaceae bacterium]
MLRSIQLPKSFFLSFLAALAFVVALDVSTDVRGADDAISLEIVKPSWSLTIEQTSDGARFLSGKFGDLDVLPGEIFRIRIEDKDGNSEVVASESDWRETNVERTDDLLKLRFSSPKGRENISVEITGELDDQGVSWSVDVENESQEYSVVEASYPFPIVAGKPLNLFVPDRCGRAIIDAGTKGFRASYGYPDHVASMQYFACWGDSDGIYLGVHDPDGCLKYFPVDVAKGVGTIRAIFPAIGAGEVANSFSLAGKARWEAFSGDWYDATMLYKAFVLENAKWLPEPGRPDTSDCFKQIAYWICDYIPNSEKQGNARPGTLGAASEQYPKGYWIDAAIQLQERLGVPVGYQVYNWHEIPFNINYPHFLPAREEFVEGIQKLKDSGLYVFPYINAVSWEMDDADEGFEENFANVGVHGAALKPDGTPYFYPYPQLKSTGEKTRLAPICPSFERWGQIIEEITRGLESTVPIDGIYFDQISAVAPAPCRNPEHDHRPGGGSYWVEGYNKIMAKIRENRPENAFYYSESNAEPYMKSFDGYLTWIWTLGDQVPAFPALYAGRVLMLGRYTDGANRADDAYFRYHLAESLTFGQQPGWLNANVVYNEERTAFLEKIVRTRFQYSDLFNAGLMLRPPVVESNLQPVASSGITMKQVVAGAWKKNDESSLAIFVVNVSKQPAKVTLKLFPKEYGVDLPESLELDLEPLEVRVLDY